MLTTVWIPKVHPYGIWIPDGDGYGVEEESISDCTVPQGYADNANDCDDNNASINPTDNDQDGLSTCEGDCDDSDNCKWL